MSTSPASQGDGPQKFVASGFGVQSDLQRMQELFMNAEGSLDSHLAELRLQRDVYIAELMLQLHTVDVPRAVKVRALLAAFELRDAVLIATLLANVEAYGLPEVITACRHLDAKRKIRVLQRKITSVRTEEVAAWEAKPKAPKGEEATRSAFASRGRGRGRGRGRATSPTPVAHRKRPREADSVPRKIKRAIKKLKEFERILKAAQDDELIPTLNATLSGHNCRYFQEWVKRVTDLSLKHYLLEFGSLEMWKELADLIHVNPNELQLPVFLAYAFEDKVDETLSADLQYALTLKKKYLSPAAEKTSAAVPRGRGRGRGGAAGRGHLAPSLKSEITNIVRHKVPLTLLRKLQPASDWDETLKDAVASYTDITTVFWWIEELRCPKVEKQLIDRLAQGELPKFGYGKMMERLMWCNGVRSLLLPQLIPHAEALLKDYTLPLKTPMAVLGDCSGSMQVAVRTASIIVSLLTALGSADLYFFNRHCVKPSFVPSTIHEAIICSDEVVADGSTSPAAALEPLLLNKRRVETLVVVTDEQENDAGPVTNLMFADLFEQYKEEVSPECFLVLVSFLGPSDEGQMATILASKKIPFLQCRLSSSRPDLTKLDLLLGKLSMETEMHRLATRAVSAYLLCRPNPLDAAREIRRFVESFVREGASGVARFIRRICTDHARSEELFTPFHVLLNEFLTGLQSTVVAKQCLEKLNSIHSLGELQQWLNDEWNTNLIDSLGLSCYSSKGLKFERQGCGTLTRVPREVLDIMASYMPLSDLKELEKTDCTLSGVAREAKFLAKFTQKEGEFEEQLNQMRGMGLLEMFAEDVVLSTLRTTKGNVEHCIALLFGEGRRR